MSVLCKLFLKKVKFRQDYFEAPKIVIPRSCDHQTQALLRNLRIYNVRQV